MLGLYIHIPFCKRKCFYCDFFSQGYEIDLADRYVEALIVHLGKFDGLKVGTIYIGGGTPSVLSVKQLKKLCSAIRAKFDLSDLKEWTIEANPESLTQEKLILFRGFGINRLSLGLQSCNNKNLKKLGRVHDFEHFDQAFFMAKQTGFDNINIDLIYGIPNQSFDEWKAELKVLCNFESCHISLYPLAIEEGTEFYDSGVRVDEGVQADMYEAADNFLASRGYVHYEISNWARDNKESQHNNNYWRNQHYIGIGAGASGYLDMNTMCRTVRHCDCAPRHCGRGLRPYPQSLSEGCRYKNVPDIKKYINLVQENKNPATNQEIITKKIYDCEKIILGLRLLNEGINIKNFQGNHKLVLNKFLNQKVLINDKTQIKLSKQYIFTSNQVLSEFC